MRFSGRRDGCDLVIDLTGEDARNQLFVDTVDPQLALIAGSSGVALAAGTSWASWSRWLR